MEWHPNRPIGALVAAFAAVLAVVALSAAPAAAQSRIVRLSDDSKHAGEFVVPINKSQILQLDVPFADLLVGNADIADVLALTDRSIYLLGKALGSTSLTIYGRDKKLIAVADLVVTHDIDGLKARLFELMPEETIEVRPINRSIVLSGMVSSANRLNRALTIAQQFAGGEGSVTNLMSVEGSQQVMLRVRFSEVSRSASKDLGLSSLFFSNDFVLSTGLGALSNDGGVAFIPEGSPFAASVGLIDLGNLPIFGSSSLALAFDALESNGLSKTLAEPNLVALSGETASFLAGGEFPVPVDQGDEGVTIEFKDFGVSLAFTPTVLEDGLINLIVSPEVSAIDQSNQVILGGGSGDDLSSRIVVPGLTVRRATTTIELRDGQSFAIAGLLQSDFGDAIQQFPWVGDLPILGALFRSSNYQRNETELVILVTPHLVQPAPAGSLASPTDNFVPPSDIDFFVFGRLEAPESGIGPLGANAGGGIDGSYGHIIK